MSAQLIENRNGGNGNGKDGGTDKRLRGIHVWWMAVAFFGTIFLADGYLMYMAVSTHSGLDTTNSYRRGLDYNDRIAQGDKQAALRWSTSLDLPPSNDRLTLSIKDRGGFAVPGLKITGVLSRPATIAFDRKLALAEGDPGQYRAHFKALPPGNWIVNIEAAQPGDAGDVILYRLRKRLWLTPKK